MQFPWEQKSKLRAAKRGWSPLLLVVLWLCFFIALDWKVGIHFVAIAALGLLLWSIFGEPNTIAIKRRYFNLPCKTKIALISDLHLGIYKKQGFLKRVIKRVNTLHIDYLFIAGDLTYYPNIKKLEELFAPLKESNCPVYLVLGNHDVEKPGHPVRKELEKAIQNTGARLLNNAIVHLSGFTLVGLGEYRSHEDDVSLLETIQSKLPIIVLTHNPITIKKYTERHHVDLTLCGHTHGWQIRLPFLEKGVGMFSSKLKHSSRGYLTHKTHNYFITGGVGEVGLPIRFFSPPTIDVLYMGEKRRTLSKQIKDQLKDYRNKITDVFSMKNT
ncbi:MAG: metallophosphoesterase [Candidatus Absconditabacteria bacterium]